MSDSFISTAGGIRQQDSQNRLEERVAEAGSVARHHGDAAQDSETGVQDDRSSDQRGDQKAHPDAREPAVSISPSATPVARGDEIQAIVQRTDAEGRPIIDTAVARFALKPDADLVAGNRIDLKVTNTERALTADLLKIDKVALEKPKSLELAIIALHRNSPDLSAAQGATSPSLSNPQQAYALNSAGEIQKAHGNTLNAQQVIDATLQAATHLKTSVVSDATASVASTKEASVLPPAPDGSASIAQVPNNRVLAGQLSQIPAATAGQPLAQIAAQLAAQLTGPANTENTNTSIAATLSGEGPAIQHLLAIAADEEAGKLTTPLATPALNAQGKSVLLTLVDPSLSAFSPLKTEQVLAVEAQSVESLKLYQAPAQFLSAAAGLPSALITDGGRYLLSVEASATLVGQTVTVQSAELSGAISAAVAQLANNASTNALGATPTIPSNSPKLYEATLATEQSDESISTAFSDSVKVQFQAANAGADGTGRPEVPLGALPLSKVRIENSYLGPKGPLTDIRASTLIGDLALTLPSSERPVAGDFVQIHYPEADESVGNTAAPAQISAAISTNTTPATANELVTGRTENLESQTTASSSLNPAGTDKQTSQVIASGIQATTLPPITAGHVVSVESEAETPLQDAISSAIVLNDPRVTSSLQERSAEGGAKLTNSILFFLTALGKKVQNPASLIGEKAEIALKALDDAKLTTLSTDMTRMAQAALEAPFGEWRQLSIPFDVRDGTAQMLNFLFREHPVSDHEAGDNTGDQEEDSQTATDFVMEVAFSVLGDIRLDGRVADKQFDLMLTTAHELPIELKSDLANLFYNANDANGYFGSLIFRDALSSSP